MPACGRCRYMGRWLMCALPHQTRDLRREFDAARNEFARSSSRQHRPHTGSNNGHENALVANTTLMSPNIWLEGCTSACRSSSKPGSKSAASKKSGAPAGEHLWQAVHLTLYGATRCPSGHARLSRPLAVWTLSRLLNGNGGSGQSDHSYSGIRVRGSES